MNWLRVRGVALAQTIADRRLFGTRPSRGVVICGFPRSGSTLLQLMLETAYPSSLHFGRERAGLWLARHQWPGRHALVISKRPNDVFWIDEIRRAMANRVLKPCFIVTTRDPRAILTSKHSGGGDYYVSVDRWKAIFDHIRYARQFTDVVAVEYRRLVERPDEVQRVVVAAIGAEPEASFEAYAKAVPAQFDTRALNGVRPLDTSGLEKWRRPEHRERLRYVLAAMPELPAVLVEEGYEPDASWTEEYR